MRTALNKAGEKRRSPLASALAKPGDPLVTAKGQVIAPNTGRDITSLKDAIRPAEYRPLKRRSLRDVSGEPGEIRAVSLAFSLTLLGLADAEIGQTMKVTKEELDIIRAHRAYEELFNAIMDEFINANSELIQVRLAAFSHSALNTVADISQNGRNEKNKLDASRDILDRVGVKAEDRTKKSGQISELRIRITKGETKISVDAEGGRVEIHE